MIRTDIWTPGNLILAAKTGSSLAHSGHWPARLLLKPERASFLKVEITSILAFLSPGTFGDIS
jgi:hypothetical protein